MSTLKLKGSSSGEAQVTVAAAAGTPTFTLSTTVGSANQLLKNSSTAGTLEFSSLVEDSSGNVTVNSTALNLNGTGATFLEVGSSNASGAYLILDGDSNGDGDGGDYAYIAHDTSGDLQYVADNPAATGNHIFKTGGSAERMRIHSNGAVTKPTQPIASLSHSGVIDVSNDELDSGNCYDTIRVNLGSHFDASTGRFTCPVAGTYRIFFAAAINSESTNVRLRKNGVTLNEAYSDDLNAVYNVSQEMIIDAAANDYLHIYVSGLKTMSGAQHKQITFELIA